MRDEEGAVAVVVAILSIVIFGFGAIAVDAGQLYQEKRELQNGADAAALAAALDCADPVTAVTCVATSAELNGRIDEYANANANDGASEAWVEELNLTDAYITVGTETISGGNGFLTHWLAGVLGQPTNTVRAMATAAWGTMGGGAGLPLAFSYCEWIDLVPDLSALPSTSETIYFHSPNDTTDDCSGPAGQDTPGGFGWLDGDAGECEATIDAQQEAGGDTGNNVPQDCTSQFWEDLIGETVLVPIFSSVTGTGTNATYYIEGFAAFELEGYRLNGGNGQYSYPTPAPCLPQETCIRGRFVDYVAYGDHISQSGVNYGVTIVTLTK